MAGGRNDFLLQFLGLQQDGRHSISGPDRWENPVPLAVNTEVGDFLVEHAEGFVSVADNVPGRWHFLIGSPGNGKSAAVGDLYRRLTTELDCEADPLDPDEDTLPYRVEVRRRGERFSRLWLVQDASTITDPMAGDIDAAGQLAGELREAQDHGVSLVVCANRGVLERVYDQHKTDEDWYRRVVVALVQAGGGRMDGYLWNLPPRRQRRRYSSIKVAAHFLDNQNLLRGETSPFQLLVEKAVDEANWKPCEDCDSAELCPFYANSRSLRTGGWSDRLITLLRRAEVWSGQPIVFREAVSLVGYLLGGCPHDYETPEGGSRHPCEWVEHNVASANLVTLLSRRIYAAVFGTPEPGGLDADPEVRERQRSSLEPELTDMDPVSPGFKMVRSFLRSREPSIDVGASRLLGSGGVFRAMDPVRLPSWAGLRDRWSLHNGLAAASGLPGVSELELRAISGWIELDMHLEDSTETGSREAQRLIARWASSFLLRLGGFASPHDQVWSYSLDRYIEILNAATEDTSAEDTLDLLDVASDMMTRTLDRRGGEAEGVRVSHCLIAAGPAAERLASADVIPVTDDPGLALGIAFGERGIETSDPVAYMTGQLWAWLSQAKEGLLPSCLPAALVQGLEIARTRAVTSGDYARAPDTELLIEGEDGRRWRMQRRRGRVRVIEQEAGEDGI
jgi:hypothetical protein